MTRSLDSSPTKRQLQGQSSRELILDATEELMAARGFAATSISDIRNACGLPPSSIYWHFGSKEGVLAAVMERGAQRFFAAIPAEADPERQLAAAAAQQEQHPLFLRLFLLLSLERTQDSSAAEIVRRVRDTAIAGFRAGIATMLPPDAPPGQADRVTAELAAVATAMSDGIFLAKHLEPDSTDASRMYHRLYQMLTALIPILMEEE